MRLTALKSVAVVALWGTKLFDTTEIAHAVGAAEADVERVLHIAREERRTRRVEHRP